jgi:hypothetical protein
VRPRQLALGESLGEHLGADGLPSGAKIVVGRVRLGGIELVQDVPAKQGAPDPESVLEIEAVGDGGGLAAESGHQGVPSGMSASRSSWARMRAAAARESRSIATSGRLFGWFHRSV